MGGGERQPKRKLPGIPFFLVVSLETSTESCILKMSLSTAPKQIIESPLQILPLLGTVSAWMSRPTNRLGVPEHLNAARVVGKLRLESPAFAKTRGEGEAWDRHPLLPLTFETNP